MCACVYVLVYICICLSEYVFLCVFVYVCMYVNKCLCWVCNCVCLCVYLSICFCVYLCMSVCVSVHVCPCVCVTSGRKVPRADMPRLADAVCLTRKQLSSCCSQRFALPDPLSPGQGNVGSWEGTSQLTW